MRHRPNLDKTICEMSGQFWLFKDRIETDVSRFPLELQTLAAWWRGYVLHLLLSTAVKCAELWLYVTLWEDVLLVVFSGVDVAGWPVLPNHKHPVAISGHAYAQLSAVLPHHLGKMTCREKTQQCTEVKVWLRHETKYRKYNMNPDFYLPHLILAEQQVTIKLFLCLSS